ncbi:MAG: biotin/lipoyl-binding protein [Anaerolineae bacterium]|nr:biotin/lipoyl-binding protein [Anaerolineae bacterium]MCI0608913.1 biotin/lipoyl-binding protein [Anaerolineae bacterium]
MKITFDTQTLELTPSGSGKSYRVGIGDRTVDVEIIHAESGKLDLLIDGQRVTAYVSSDGARRWVTVNGQTFVLTKSSDAKRRGAGHDHASELAAPMPGQVRGVNVSEGDVVTKGQTLLVLEAMKMEIRIQAPRDGVIKKLFVNQGQTVEREQILVEIEES